MNFSRKVSVSKMKESKEKVETKESQNVIEKLVKQLAFSALVIVALSRLTTFFVSTFFDVENPWQNGWNKVVDRFGEDPFTYHIYGTALVMILKLINSFFLLYPIAVLKSLNIFASNTIVLKNCLI